MNASSSDSQASHLTKSQIGKMRMGAKARERRGEKYRLYMNQIFEEKRLAALERFKIHFDCQRYRDEVHEAMIGKKPSDSYTDCAVEVDDAKIENHEKETYNILREKIAIKSDHLVSANSRTSEIWHDLNTTITFIEHEKKISENDQMSTSIPSSGIEESEVVNRPETPEYAPSSPVGSHQPLESATEICYVGSSIVEVASPEDKTPIFIHPQKATTIILTTQEHPKIEKFEDFVENIPLKLRGRKPIRQFVPRTNCVFQTHDERVAYEFHRSGYSVIAHLAPKHLQTVRYGKTIDPQKPYRAGVLTFVSLNKIENDVGICKDSRCIANHRQIRNRDVVLTQDIPRYDEPLVRASVMLARTSWKGRKKKW